MKRILLLFLVIVCIFIVLSKVDYRSWFPFGKHTMEANVTTKTDMINIDVSGVNAKIVPENRDNLQAELKGTGKVIVKQSGDSITVSYERQWFEWFSFLNKTKLTIYIPEYYHQNMTLTIGSGNLDFTGPASASMKLNNIMVDMGSGNLDLKNLHVNHLNHNGLSGNATIESVITKDSTFDVSSGNVTVKHFNGKLKTVLLSGNFKAQLDQLNNSVDVQVSSGNVQLDLPQDADFTLNGKISSGIISNDFPLKNEKGDRRYLQGIHGSGKYPVDLSVSSGRIKIY